MANLISPSELAEYKGAIDDMHDTFGRPILVWLPSQQTITIPQNDLQDDDYDNFYDNKVGSKSSIVYTPVSVTVKARIKYLDRQELEFGLLITSPQNRVAVTQDSRVIRIKVTINDSENYIEKCEKITVDGHDYERITSAQPSGIVTLDYVKYYFQAII